MKYYKRLKVYKSYNLIFDPHNIKAWSYNRQILRQLDNGIVFFNNRSNGPSDTRHINKILQMVNKMDIHIDVWFKFSGLSFDNSLSTICMDEISLSYIQIAELKRMIQEGNEGSINNNNKRRWQRTTMERLIEVDLLREAIGKLGLYVNERVYEKEFI